MARRRPNAELRTREYLTEAEIERLLDAVKDNRWGHRDMTMILVAFRHGLRVGELIDLRWDQIEFENARLHVRRAKNGTPSVHPIHGDELRALRRLRREQDPKSRRSCSRPNAAGRSRYRRSSGWSRAPARPPELGFAAHPHMLRHACGYALTNRGLDTRALQAYLGHKSIQQRCDILNWRPAGSRIYGDDHHDQDRLRKAIVSASATTAR